MFFCKNNREHVMKGDGNLSFCEVGKILGQRWRGMNDEQKLEYVKMSEKDKVRYESEGGAEARKKAQEAAGVTNNKKKKAKKVRTGPKRSLSAFMYYAQEKRGEIKAENPGITFGEIGKAIGRAWKLCTPEEKEPYNKLAAKDKLRYESELNDMSRAQAEQEEQVKSESEDEESGSESESSGSGSGSDDGSDSEESD